MAVFPTMPNNSVGLTLTDIPYGEVSRESGGLRTLDKKSADIMTFDLHEFLCEVYRVTSSTAIIFCGKEQFSMIHGFFAEKQLHKHGTVRQLIYQKTNPSPMNGEHIYLSGIENAVWFKKSGGTFNAKCKNTVFKYPNGSSKLHPTEKNAALLAELISDNSAPGDIVFDPCCGSGSHCLAAQKLGRRYIGVELNENYYNIAADRLRNKQGSLLYDYD
jgi:site-specific DNA-methyltransferase (adenine-specific)